MGKKMQLNKITARFISNQPYKTINNIIIPPNQTIGPTPEGSTACYPAQKEPPLVIWEGKASDIDPQHEQVDFILRTWLGVCLQEKSIEQVQAEEDAYRARYPKRFPPRH
ncbi:hypothetical protein pEaSNUABM10_00038 [Erwinia phage pEa_SNUABM_10]|nr:hypothetical protein pEaSNUABM10_00038 [Erwinia phage pEa_SNUABM_10]